MNLDRSLLKDFAKVTAPKPQDLRKQYVRGTIVIGANETKCVKLDGSEMLTPISGVVDYEAGDRVLVSVENHQATVLGNFTFPPSARKEQDALDQAGQAQDTSNKAQQLAQSANQNASEAITQSSIANALANEAKQEAAAAQQSANTASQKAESAKQQSAEANKQSAAAQQSANEAKESVSAANNEISRINTEVSNVKNNVSDALTSLDGQAKDIEAIKTTYTTKVETENVHAELSTEISKKVGELSTNIAKTYAAKTDLVTIEGKLQTQITQNADGLASQATKIEKVQSDTAQAQQDVNKALEKAAIAQTNAENAKSTADSAQAEATLAQQNATTAQQKADNAKSAADKAQLAVEAADKNLAQAKTDLAEAKQNLVNVTNRVDATEKDILDAQNKVNEAQTAVNGALEQVAEAQVAAGKAQQSADKAQQDATTAQSAANAAQQKADSAKQTADNASKDALQAQKDVANLTNRVTSAETKINQNAENITLQATKTTEIKNTVDGVKNDLTNKYYNKEQADAAIKLSADGIKNEVSKSYMTKVEGKDITDAANNALANANDAKDKIDNLQIGGRNYIYNGKGNAKTGFFTNFTDINDGYCEVDFVDKSYVSTGYSYYYIDISKGFAIPVRDYVEGDIYTFSFEFMFTKYTTSTPVTIGEWWVGQRYTTHPDSSAVVDGKWKGVTQVVYPRPTSVEHGVWHKFEKTITIPKQASEGVRDESRIMMAVKGNNSNGTFTLGIKFRNVKLEKGSKATDWTPAPEDVESDSINNINSAIKQSTSTITENYKTLINQTAKDITAMVTQIKETTDGNTSSIASLSNQLQITSEMAQFVKTTTENLQQAVDGKVSASEIKEWARFDGATLELGASNQPFKCRLTTTELAFYQGTNKVAWISNNELNILTAIIAKSIGCGNFTFVDEGSLGFSLI